MPVPFKIKVTKEIIALSKNCGSEELEIIGEATNNLLKINADLPLTSARKIVNLRNRVIHNYDDVDEIIIWNVIVTDIPRLLEEVQQLLIQN